MDARSADVNRPSCKENRRTEEPKSELSLAFGTLVLEDGDLRFSNNALWTTVFEEVSSAAQILKII